MQIAGNCDKSDSIDTKKHSIKGVSGIKKLAQLQFSSNL